MRNKTVMAICDASLFSIATSLAELERIDGGAEEERGRPRQVHVWFVQAQINGKGRASEEDAVPVQEARVIGVGR